jgi:hypothetical protein
MSRSLLLVAAVLVVPSLASAGTSKAWTAAKKNHVDAPIIMGFDVASAKASDSFKQIFPKLIAKKPEVQDVLAKLQTTCSFDPFKAISSVVAVVDDANDPCAFYIALTGGWNTKKLAECGKKIAKAEGKTLISKTTKKNIQELSLSGKDDHLYLGTIGKDVVVMTTKPTDSAFLETVMASKGGTDADKLVAKLDTGSTVWMAVIKSKEIQPGVQMKAVFGTIHIANSNVNVDVHAQLSDAATATKLVDDANKQMPAQAAKMPPMIQNIVKTVKLTADGADVHATASATEKDVLALLQMAVPM